MAWGVITREVDSSVLHQHRLILCSTFRGFADVVHHLGLGFGLLECDGGHVIGALSPTNKRAAAMPVQDTPKLDYELGKNPLASDLCDTFWWRAIHHL